MNSEAEASVESADVEVLVYLNPRSGRPPFTRVVVREAGKIVDVFERNLSRPITNRSIRNECRAMSRKAYIKAVPLE